VSGCGLWAVGCRLPRMSTVAVVLAVEPGEGFETPRYLVDLGGKPMLEGIVDDVLGWPVDDVVVVLGSDADEIAGHVDFGSATIIMDPGWSEGASSPIRASLDLITRDRSVDLVLFVRGDQPGIETGLVVALMDRAREGGADAVVPKYRYSYGWPVVVGPALWNRLLSLEGPLDVLDVINTHASARGEVWVEHLEPPCVVVPDDLTEIHR
jgi:CTP:molybdopterin cytidylyltransferase MocA